MISNRSSMEPMAYFFSFADCIEQPWTAQLTLSLLMTTQVAFVDCVNQDQT